MKASAKLLAIKSQEKRRLHEKQEKMLFPGNRQRKKTKAGSGKHIMRHEDNNYKIKMTKSENRTLKNLGLC